MASGQMLQSIVWVLTKNGCLGVLPLSYHLNMYLMRVHVCISVDSLSAIAKPTVTGSISWQSIKCVLELAMHTFALRSVINHVVMMQHITTLVFCAMHITLIVYHFICSPCLLLLPKSITSLLVSCSGLFNFEVNPVVG